MPVVIPAPGRETDRKDHPMRYARTRKSVGGLVCVLAGCAYAFYNKEQPWIGFTVALVGAGIVDPSSVLPARRSSVQLPQDEEAEG